MGLPKGRGNVAAQNYVVARIPSRRETGGEPGATFPVSIWVCEGLSRRSSARGRPQIERGPVVRASSSAEARMRVGGGAGLGGS